MYRAVVYHPNLVKLQYVTGLRKYGMWAHDFCLTSITQNFLYPMQILALRKRLTGFMMQVTECKHFVPILRYGP